MARRDPHDGPGRLATLLDPRPGDRWAGDGPYPDTDTYTDTDPPTQPLPVGPQRRLRFGGPPERRWRERLVARWTPAAWRGARLDPGRPAALALLLTATVSALLAAVGVWWEAPRAQRAPDLPALVDTAHAPAASGPASPGPASPGTTPTAGPPEPLVVAVAGRVARPGLVRVPPGARVADVLVAAGGPLPGADLAGVNLARKVRDGEQVAVGVPGATDAAPTEAGSAAAAGADGPGPTDGPLDLNAATVEQLDALPGVGPVMAQRIVDWRTRNGRFATVDQLREVEGIGERRLDQLRALVRV